MGEPITVETDIFEHRQVKPHFINPCCFGEDFAAWLKEELSKDGDLKFKFSEAIQEDYGWVSGRPVKKSGCGLRFPTQATGLRSLRRSGSFL
ncbi:MAG TPA: hypothetical protein VGH51_03310 [Candidatus Angelobacter sp.]|jgi:hypothetical protein